MALTKPNYVLVDYENVQTLELERVAGLPVKVVLFIGSNQKRVPVELLRKVCAIPGCVEVIESVDAGKNALDFQMACHAGRIAEREPGAFLHFVSRDKGFDAVVRFLKDGGRLAARVDSFSSLAFLNQKDFRALSFEEQLEFVLTRLSKTPVISRPRKLSTLRTSVSAMLGKQLDKATIELIVEALKAQNKIFAGPKGNITYPVEAKSIPDVDPGWAESPEEAALNAELQAQFSCYCDCDQPEDICFEPDPCRGSIPTT
jgi:hypothetical protein